MIPITVFFCGTLMPPVLGPLLNWGLTKAWKEAIVKTLPKTGLASLEETYQALARWLDSRIAPDQPLTLVGQSQGGLHAVRLALDRPNVERVITISTAHHGTVLANFIPPLWDMRPESAYMKAYLARLPEVAPRLDSIYLRHDLMIHPYHSAHVDDARNHLFASPEEYLVTGEHKIDTVRLDGNPNHISELYNGPLIEALRLISINDNYGHIAV